jgi:hypothetical protein
MVFDVKKELATIGDIFYALPIQLTIISPNIFSIVAARHWNS